MGRKVIGVDEAGRGCLAGPVFAGAVMMPRDLTLYGLTDSKLLSEARRETLFENIMMSCRVGVGIATVDEIAEINILHASLLAMRRAVEDLNESEPDLILVDGNKTIPGLEGPQKSLVKGDLRADPVAAASIIAKVSRDRLMKDLEVNYPGYGLFQHKGYGTKAHREAIKSLGPAPIHRRTFSGVREHL